MARTVRFLPEPIPDIVVRIPEAPAPPGPVSASGLAAPVVGAAAFGIAMGVGGSPSGWLFGIAGMAAALGARAGDLLGGRLRHRHSRREHLRRLAVVDRRIEQAADAWILRLGRLHPPPSALPTDRIWERRPGDADFLVGRLGTGPVAVPMRVDPPGRDVPRQDPRISQATVSVRAARTRPGPVLVDLGGNRVVALVGRADATNTLAATLAVDLAWFHHPEDLRLRLPADPAFDPLRSLPHVTTEPAPPGRLIVDAGDGPAVVHLRPRIVPPATDVVIDLDRGTARHPDRRRPDHGIDRVEVTPDAVIEVLRRRRPAGPEAQPAPPVDGRPPLVAPVGVDGAGLPVEVDLREAARGGSGPHLLLVGATGSGKSELLRTLVSGLTRATSVDRVQLLLVDFKGGAAFRPFAGSPHVAGFVSDLAIHDREAARLHDALAAEVRRRKEVLASLEAEDVDGAVDGEGRPALPRLVVVVDEFAELLERHPDLSGVLETIGRSGRSLGFHLVLAGQRPDPGLLRRLEGHLRLRICLRVFTAEDSLAVIGTADAARLPAAPGHGVLSVDGRHVTFRSVRAPVVPGQAHSSRRARPIVPEPLPSVAPAALGDPPGLVALRDEGGGPVPTTIDLDTMPSLLVVGGPRSGKSGAARAVALAAGTAPERLDCVLVGGPGLADLERLVHVAGVIPPDDPDGLHALLEDRGTAVRRTVVVVDGLDMVAGDDRWMATIDGLLDRGPGRGIHLIATASRARSAAGRPFGRRIELHLPDPHDRRNERNGGAPPGIPGRGVADDGAHVQFLHVPAPVPGALAARIALARGPTPPATGPERLPQVVHGAGLPPGAAGILLPGLRPWCPSGDLVVVGDPGSGRTSVLRAVAAAGHDPVPVDDADRPGGLGRFESGGSGRGPIVASVAPGPLLPPPVRAMVDAGADVLMLDAGSSAPPIRGVRHRRLPPGRGLLVDRSGRARLLQVALPPAGEASSR